MNISLANQVFVFWVSVLGGAVTGVVFDFFRAFRKRIKSSAFSVAVQDILFWLISAGVVFCFMYSFNDGEPRWYIFCGMVLGALIYHNTISALVVEFIIRTAAILYRLILILIKTALFPVWFLLKILRGPFLVIMIPVKSLGRFCRRGLRAARGSLGKNLKKIKNRLKLY